MEMRDVNGDSVIQSSLTRAEELTPAQPWGMHRRLRVLESKQSSGHGGACLHPSTWIQEAQLVLHETISTQNQMAWSTETLSGGQMSQRLRSSVESGPWHSSLLGFKLTISNQATSPSPQMMLFSCLFFPIARMLPCPVLHTAIFGWIYSPHLRSGQLCSLRHLRSGKCT